MKSFFVKEKEKEQEEATLQTGSEEIAEKMPADIEKDKKQISDQIRGFKGALTKKINDIEFIFEKFEELPPLLAEAEIKNLINKVSMAKEKVISHQILLIKNTQDLNEGKLLTTDMTDIENRVELVLEKAEKYLIEIKKKPVIEEKDRDMEEIYNEQVMNQGAGAKPKLPEKVDDLKGHLDLNPINRQDIDTQAKFSQILDNSNESPNPFYNQLDNPFLKVPLSSTPNVQENPFHIRPPDMTGQSPPTSQIGQSPPFNPFQNTPQLGVDHLAQLLSSALGVNYDVRIDVPENFSGEESNVEESFHTFITRWENAVRRMRTLNKTEGEVLRTLKTCLKGQAKKAIEGIPEAQGNYTTAINLLKDLYSNRQKMARDIITQLVDYTPDKTNDLTALRGIYTCLTETRQRLQNMSISEGEFSRLVFITFIERKLPKQVREAWVRKFTELNKDSIHSQKVFIPSLELFFNTLLTQLQKLSTLPSTTPKQHPNSAMHKSHLTVSSRPNTTILTQGQMRPPYTATFSGVRQPSPRYFSIPNNSRINPPTTYAARAQQQRTGPPPLPCPFCNLNPPNHKPYNCNNYSKLPVEKRWESIINAKVCSGCFIPLKYINHPFKECYIKCTICNKKHHTSLHLETFKILNFKNSSNSGGKPPPPPPTLGKFITNNKFAGGGASASNINNDISKNTNIKGDNSDPNKNKKV